MIEEGLSDGCFNPRPRAGGDLELPGLNALAEVSIRAPVRGATAPDIHLPDPAMWFQSAPPCGGRPTVRDYYLPVTLVSIRAPVRGATTGIRRQRQ